MRNRPRVSIPALWRQRGTLIRYRRCDRLIDWKIDKQAGKLLVIAEGWPGKECAMRKWYVPLTIAGIGGLGVFLFSESGRRALRWIGSYLRWNSEGLLEWNEAAEAEMQRIRQHWPRLRNPYSLARNWAAELSSAKPHPGKRSRNRAPDLHLRSRDLVDLSRHAQIALGYPARVMRSERQLTLL